MNPSRLNDEGKELWNQKAQFWDKLQGERGNRFHQELVSPSVETLIGQVDGKQILDIGCGNGQLARRMAELGAKVTATDFSENLIQLAQKRGTPIGFPIQYLFMDATDEKALLSLGVEKFDCITSTMAFMDIPDLEPMFRAAKNLLKAHGFFVFATGHPAFFTNNTAFISEMNEIDGKAVYTHSLRVTHYLHLPPQKGVGAPNEPTPHYYFHRPLHELLGVAFKHGFVLDALLEPTFSPQPGEEVRPLSWLSLSQIPPIITGRFQIR